MRSKSHLESHYIFQILFMLSEQMDSRPTKSNSSSSSSTVDSATTSRSYLTLIPSNHLQIKLAKDKYLSWKTAILPYINGNKILHHVHGSTGRPPKTIVSLLCGSASTIISNPEYAHWFELDQLVF